MTGSGDGQYMFLSFVEGAAIDTANYYTFSSCISLFGGSEFESGCGILEIDMDPLLARGTVRGEIATHLSPTCCWEGRPGRIRVDILLEAADVPIPGPIPPVGAHQCAVGVTAFGGIYLSRAATPSGTLVSEDHGSLMGLAKDASLAQGVFTVNHVCVGN